MGKSLEEETLQIKQDAVAWFLEGVFTCMDEDYAMTHNDYLTDTYKSSLEVCGYETFYDAFLDMSMTLEPIQKGGEKDLSKLNATKRTVIRNGKPVEITVYTKNENDEEGDQKGTGESDGTPSYHAKEMKSSVEKDSKKAQNIAKYLSKQNGTPYSFKSTMTFYMTLRDNDGKPVAVVGYKLYGHYLKMVFIQTNGTIAGAGSRGFYEMVKYCLSKELGLKLDKSMANSPFITMYDMQEDSRGDFYLGYETLVKEFGEG